ncbi:hypothetical protein ONZ45_g4049 [Pleurotus djamor]|nr:hypothetical protein ONZ45_g4049 [Pleurotus djamor]
MSHEARVQHQRKLEAKSAKLLRNAITRASKKGYNSRETRNIIIEAFKKHTELNEPYPWQLDVSEALLLGLDSIVIAGTGAGKTMPFVLPLYSNPKKVVVIISPLNALEEDQAARFEKMGLRAIALNGETYNGEIHNEIELGKVQVIITSPEMCLQHDGFRRLLSAPKFAEKILSIVIDEAHCISQWGKEFRPEYSKLGTLRAFVPATVPFLVTSATLPNQVLSEVMRVMHIQHEDAYHVNLGTDRHNIAWFLRQMDNATNDYASLSFLFPENPSRRKAKAIPPTFVFLDDINLGMEVIKWLRDRIGEQNRDRIHFYHSRRSARGKKRMLKRFRRGKIRVLLTTEAAGMGCDIPNIARVVQFFAPSSLEVWMQRAGRAGRNPDIEAEAILLVQPTVLKEKKAAQGAESGDGATKYWKDVEPGLRSWIEAVACRREEAAVYFDDGCERKTPKGACCDNCLRVAQTPHPLLQSTPSTSPPTTEAAAQTQSEPSSHSNANGKRPMTETIIPPPSDSHAPSPPAKKPVNRRDDHLRGARALLIDWRSKTWSRLYSKQIWGVQALLSDKAIGNLATRPIPHASTERLKKEGMAALFAQKHGEEILKCLGEYDREWNAKHNTEKKERSDAKKAETAIKRKAKADQQKEEKRIQREAAKAIQATQPKRQRPSRAKKGATAAALAPSTSRHPIQDENQPPQHAPPSFATPQMLSRPDTPPFIRKNSFW